MPPAVFAWVQPLAVAVRCPPPNHLMCPVPAPRFNACGADLLPGFCCPSSLYTATHCTFTLVAFC